MPDSGFNSYLSIGPDGTVVVPNNIDVNGVISAGDLATHSDVAAALVSAESYTDSAVGGLASIAYVDGGDADLQGNIDALSADVVHDANLSISRQYGAALSAAGGDLTTITASVDVFEIVDNGWAEWTLVGYPLMTSGVVQLSAVAVEGSFTVVMTFASLSTGLQDVEGTYYFYVIGRA